MNVWYAFKHIAAFNVVLLLLLVWYWYQVDYKNINQTKDDVVFYNNDFGNQEKTTYGDGTQLPIKRLGSIVMPTVISVRTIAEGKSTKSPKEQNLDSLHNIHVTIWKQIEQLQEEGECEEKKIIICENPNIAGLGAVLHNFAICLQIAYGLGRIWFLEQPEYSHFGGLNSILQVESKKCGYLKEKYKTYGDICDTGNEDCYVHPMLSINNTKKVLFHKTTRLPHPRHIQTTIPDAIYKALTNFNVPIPWLWFTSQFLGYLILRMGDNLLRRLTETSVKINITHPYVALHVRRGDKYKEANFVDEKHYLKSSEFFYNNQIHKSGNKILYLASDQDNMTHILYSKIEELGYHHYNILSHEKNHKTLNKSYFENNFPKEILEDMLIDLYFLVHSNYTICTFSSNIGRLVYELKQAIPPYRADDVFSVDNKKMFYRSYGFDDDFLKLILITNQTNTLELEVIEGQKLLNYVEGEIYNLQYDTKIRYININGHVDTIIAVHKYDRMTNKVVRGFAFVKHLEHWPGKPKYYFYS